jgi:hypothetical protein
VDLDTLAGALELELELPVWCSGRSGSGELDYLILECRIRQCSVELPWIHRCSDAAGDEGEGRSGGSAAEGDPMAVVVKPERRNVV